MNIMQSNPRQLLGEDLAVGAGNCSLTYRNKAHNDRTYVVTILGVNQDFTDDITQAEQKEIIAKYSIPENITDGDQSYYTFKLDGIYYTRRQNGNFMLYDTVLLRVPNNNWDSMFLESIGDNDTGTSYIRNIYVDVIEPPIAGKDYDPSPFSSLVYSFWFCFSSDRNGNYQYNSIYQLEFDENISELTYQKLNITISDTAPKIDSKYVSQLNGNYYWVEVNQDNAIIGMYRTTKEESGNTYKFVWDMDNPVMQAETGALIYPPSSISDIPQRCTVSMPNSGEGTPYYCYLSPFPPMSKNDLWIEVSDLSSKTCIRVQEFSTIYENNSGLGDWVQMADIPLNGIVVSESDAGEYVNEQIWVQQLLMSANDRLSSDTSPFVSNETRLWSYHTLNNYWQEELVYSMGDAPMISGSYYIEFDTDNNLVAIYRCKDDSEIWDPDNLDQIYPSTNPNDVPPIIINVPPNSEGTLWAKVNSLTSRGIISISQYLSGKWELKYSIGGHIQNMIPYPEEPIIPNDPQRNDYYVAYEESFDETEQEIVKTFRGLYIYSAVWDKISATCGKSLPTSANINDYYVIADDDFDNATIYICTETTDEGEAVWEEASVGTGYIFPYPPVENGDFWAKVDNIQNKNFSAIYQRINNEWAFIGNIVGGVGEYTDQWHTTERFNDYREHYYDDEKHKWVGGNHSDLRYDHVEGYENKVVFDRYPSGLYYRGYNHVEGRDNYVNGNMNQCAHVEGEDNSLTGGSAMHVGGVFNNVSGGNSAIVYGQHNTVTKCYFGIVLGSYNIVGSANDSVAYCACFGEDIKLYRNYCVAIGHGYTVYHNAPYYLTIGSASLGITFSVDGAGNVNASSYSGGGADYAEYFEWLDGNPDGEDRCGMLVALDGDKIVPAYDDDILGIVSGAPAVMGNSYETHWHDKYVTDVYGRKVFDQNGDVIISDNYDDSKEYVARSERPEWDVVGMIGRLVIRDDGSCEPNKYVIAVNGIGSYSDRKTNVRVLKRIDDNHVEVFIK